MGRSSAETQLAMPRAQAWAKLRDLLLAQQYVPGVTRIEITTPQREGMGASRRVFCKGRPPVDETVIAWEDGHGFTVKLHNGDQPPKPFKQAQFVYRLDDAPGGGDLHVDGYTFEIGEFGYDLYTGPGFKGVFDPSTLEAYRDGFRLASPYGQSEHFAVLPVPEAASWAMMIAGFGLAGAAIRRRRVPALRFA